LTCMRTTMLEGHREMKLGHTLDKTGYLVRTGDKTHGLFGKRVRSEQFLRGMSMKAISYAILALFVGTIPALAITVQSPANGAQVTSPFSLVASTSSCDFENAATMGYSVDSGATTMVPTSFSASLPTREGSHILHLNGGETTIVPTSISALVVAGEGQHTLHVKCWGPYGATDDMDVNITVVTASSPPPTNVTVVSNIQSLTGWAWNHDPGTPGNSTGTSDITATPSLSGNARQYSMNFTNSGGEIYHVSFGKDTAATHFIYSAAIWLDDPSGIANIEMDLNQVLSNGDTVIFGFQCDGYSGTWDYTLNLGTPTVPEGHWEHSNVACPDPKTWTPNTWHNVQVSYSRDAAGNVTYESVVLDGQQSDFIGATGNSAFSLGWGSTLLTNFQIDGHGATGSANVYVDNLSVSRW
jgi:hypothetical protein